MNRPTDPYLDPELHDPEVPCRSCGRHQGECDGPPQRCCEACEHWTADDLATDEAEGGVIRATPRRPIYLDLATGEFSTDNPDGTA